MKLYHGTSERRLDAILSGGIAPRGEDAGNWGHTVNSHPEAVYLTVAYPHYFAVQSRKEGERGLILEIDSDLLDRAKLVPDEDALEAATRTADWESGDGRSLEDRVLYYRGRLPEFADRWESSLQLLGTCAYLGTIPSEAIIRYALVDYGKNVQLLMAAVDPVIVPMNYFLHGSRYRELVAWTFGDPTSPDVQADEVHMAMSHRLPESRAGIEIVETAATPVPGT